MDVLVLNKIRKQIWQSNNKNENFTSTVRPESFVLNPNPFILIPGITDKHIDIISTIVALVISCCSAYLAWTCDKKMPLGQRISTTILAFLLGMFYLIYSIGFITSQCDTSSTKVIT